MKIILLTLALSSALFFAGACSSSPNKLINSPPVGAGKGHDDYPAAPKPCVCIQVFPENGPPS